MWKFQSSVRFLFKNREVSYSFSFVEAIIFRKFEEKNIDFDIYYAVENICSRILL